MVPSPVEDGRRLFIPGVTAKGSQPFGNSSLWPERSGESEKMPAAVLAGTFQCSGERVEGRFLRLGRQGRIARWPVIQITWTGPGKAGPSTRCLYGKNFGSSGGVGDDPQRRIYSFIAFWERERFGQNVQIENQFKSGETEGPKEFRRERKGAKND